MPRNNTVMAKRLSSTNTSLASFNQLHVTFAQFSYVFKGNLAHWSTEKLSEWNKLLKLFIFCQALSYERGFYYLLCTGLEIYLYSRTWEYLQCEFCFSPYLITLGSCSGLIFLKLFRIFAWRRSKWIHLKKSCHFYILSSPKFPTSLLLLIVMRFMFLRS